MNDNTTPMKAKEYDNNINKTVPFYNCFYEQTIDVVMQCGFDQLDWLDLGCGTGSLAEKALMQFPSAHFCLVDPSKPMLDQAREKLKDYNIQYACMNSEQIKEQKKFNVITAIQSHHYMKAQQRVEATKRIYEALREGGIYISFENVIPRDEVTKQQELLRWGRYQQSQGKTKEEAKKHNQRCGVNYFPITVEEHINLLEQTGFKRVHVFWYSYMQMGIYGLV